MEAGGDAVAGERLLALEALADRDEHRHLPVGPLDAAHALGGEGEILDVVLDGRGHDSFRSDSVGLGLVQATSSRSCLRCSHSIQSASLAPSAGTVAPVSQRSTAARSSGSRRSRTTNATSSSSTSCRRRSSASARSRLELVLGVAAVAGRVPLRDDEAGGLEVAKHPRRPARAGGRLAHGRARHATTLPQLCEGYAMRLGSGRARPRDQRHGRRLGDRPGPPDARGRADVRRGPPALHRGDQRGDPRREGRRRDGDRRHGLPRRRRGVVVQLARPRPPPPRLRVRRAGGLDGVHGLPRGGLRRRAPRRDARDGGRGARRA